MRLVYAWSGTLIVIRLFFAYSSCSSGYSHGYQSFTLDRLHLPSRRGFFILVGGIVVKLYPDLEYPSSDAESPFCSTVYHTICSCKYRLIIDSYY